MPSASERTLLGEGEKKLKELITTEMTKNWFAPSKESTHVASKYLTSTCEKSGTSKLESCWESGVVWSNWCLRDVGGEHGGAYMLELLREYDILFE